MFSCHLVVLKLQTVSSLNTIELQTYNNHTENTVPIKDINPYIHDYSG